jgi:hypothetical protein
MAKARMQRGSALALARWFMAGYPDEVGDVEVPGFGRVKLLCGRALRASTTRVPRRCALEVGVDDRAVNRGVSQRHRLHDVSRSRRPDIARDVGEEDGRGKGEDVDRYPVEGVGVLQDRVDGPKVHRGVYSRGASWMSKSVSGRPVSRY